MLYTYDFNSDNNGNVPSDSIVEIDENSELGRLILGSDVDEKNGDRREWAHSAFSIDDDRYNGEGPALADPRTPETILLQKERQEYLDAAVRSVPSQQRIRFEKFVDGINKLEISRREGTHHSTVQESIEKAKRNVKNYFSENPY